MTEKGKTSGAVKWWNSSKGYGFLVTDEGSDVFVHRSECEKSGLKDDLSEGEKVQFDVAPGKTGKGPKAINISVL